MSIQQLTLFTEEVPIPPSRPDDYTKARVAERHPDLDKYAFLYTATENGNNSGVRFMASLEDAQRWCESEVSKGVLHGARWAYFYTKVSTFITCHWGANDVEIDMSKMTDNGEWDERLASCGVTKNGKRDCKRILEPLGIKVII